MLPRSRARLVPGLSVKLPDALTYQGGCLYYDGGACTSCSGNVDAVDLFNGTDYTGSEICFYNAGSSRTDSLLTDYTGNLICGTFCTNGDWNGASVLSSVTGEEAAALSEGPPGTDPCHALGYQLSDPTLGDQTGFDYLYMRQHGDARTPCLNP